MNLADRVANRFVRADSLGDPQEILREYTKRFKEFTEHMEPAVAAQKKYKVILDLVANPTFTGPEELEAYMAKLKALRAEIPDKLSSLAEQLIRYRGFAYLGVPAEKFCLAAIQQMVLPPKARKSIEAAQKFWGKSTKRFKPKSPYHHVEERNAEVLDIYIEDSILYLKYLKLFIEVAKVGKAHSTEGLSATSIKAGPFNVVNTGGFDAITMSDKTKLVEDCYRRMTAIGLGKVCYGNVLITNRIQANTAVQAFYLISADELFVRGDAKVTMDGVQAVCHELTHRYQHKFLANQAKVLSELYNKIKYGGGDPKFPRDKYPQKGDTVPYKGELLTVDSVDPFTNKVKLFLPDEPKARLLMPLAGYAAAKGIQMEKPDSGLYFVTPYAEKGGPGENFCEMVAYLCLGKLSGPMEELLKPLIS